VLRDGRIAECDEQQEKDLFWALRGAGGENFAIVTAFMFDTIAQPAATGFHLAWPPTAAGEVIDTWQAWAPDAPDALSASLLIKAGHDADAPPIPPGSEGQPASTCLGSLNQSKPRCRTL